MDPFTRRAPLALLLAALFTLSAFGQNVETLTSSSESAASVGRHLPTVENVGAALATGGIPDFKGFDAFVVARNETPEQIKDAVELLARSYPGHNVINAIHRKADGGIVSSSTQANLRTNAGANWQADIMANTSTPPVNLQCNYIGLTNDSGAASASDTTLASEIASNGLTRAQATYAHTSNATSYTLAKTFTASGTQAAQKSGVFTASSSGTMCFEALFTAVSLVNTDTLTFTWTVNF